MDVGDVGEVYGRVAGRYAATFSDELDRKPDDRRLLDEAAAACRGRGPVLDVGCGPGHVAAYLRRQGVAAVGVDLAPAMATEGRRRDPVAPFVVADLRQLPVADGVMSGVVAFYSLIHLPRTALSSAIQELRRTVRPRGVLLLAAHAGVGSVHADSFLGEPVAVDATLYRAGELIAAAESAGCVVEHVVERPPYGFEHPTIRLYVRATVAETT